MIGYYLMLSVMVTFVGVVTLIDWLGRRKDQKSHTRNS